MPQSITRGFTLVELLVVISIISLLIALLLPALRKTREATTMVTCLSSIRQMNMAALQYADASKDFFPIRRYNGNSGTFAVNEWGFTRHVGAIKRMTELEVIPRLDETGSPWNPYTGSNIRFCPALATAQPSKSGVMVSGDYGGKQSLSHYVFSSTVSGYISINGTTGALTVNSTHKRRADVRRPSSVYLMTESPWNVDKNSVALDISDGDETLRFRPGANVVGLADETVYWPLLTQVASYRHQIDRVNFSFVDGHARTIPFQQGDNNFGKIHYADHD
jgi:prepilin-type N-terminal cleavage/methylation domain-containing protein/prepilin-type processing-associated H-X9-DG protein